MVATGAPVRVLVRDPGRLAIEGVEVVQGDFEHAGSLARGMRGVETVFLAGRDSPAYVDQLEAAISAAEDAGVRHVVALSAIGAAADSPVALMRDHQEVEQRIRSGTTSWTFLRPHLYMQNLLRAAGVIRLNGRLTAPMGGLRMPFVDTDDVGAAAAAVLLDPSAHAGATYMLTGPAPESHDGVAVALSRLLERPVEYEPVTPEAYEASLLAAGTPDWRAADLARIASAYVPADLSVSPDVPALIGRPATSLEAFLEAHREALAG